MRSERLTGPENDFLAHMMRWGSDGYPVMKVKGGWIWNEAFGVKGAPTVYKTKRAAFAAIDAYVDILCDKHAGRLPSSV